MDGQGKDFSHAWVTASRAVRSGACELVFAFFNPAAASDYVTIYDGTDDQGEIVAILQGGGFYNGTSTTKGGSVPFAPRVPVYCSRGIYAKLANSSGRVFVQWRDIHE